jgi:hypothetical protein
MRLLCEFGLVELHGEMSRYSLKKIPFKRHRNKIVSSAVSWMDSQER